MLQVKLNKIYQYDAKDFLPKIADNSIDLIMTSPPYSQKRKSTYGGVPESEYVNWFMPMAREFKRILKPKGSFILNIKEGANGQRDTYVLELILALKREDWLWTEEYIWYKTASMPGKWPNRFRDGWERCLHFTKNKDFNMYQKAVRIPVGDWAQKRMNNLKPYDKKRTISASKSGLGRNVSNWKGRNLVYPDNVLKLAPVHKNMNHSAAYPKELPLWFIKLFTRKGNVVLDPFIGSGTTAIACLESGRKFIGIEIKKQYVNLSNKNIKKLKDQMKNR